MLSPVRNVAINYCRLFSTRSNVCAASIKNIEPSKSTLQPPEADEKKSNNQLGVLDDGGQVFTGFTYYPRFPGEEDPPYEPSKVLMVQRIYSSKNRPYWEKNVLKQFGLLETRSSEIALLPNTPTTCAKLWKVKHLVRVTPVTFPQGLPKDGDVSGARLNDNGELTFIPQLKSDAKMVESQEKPEIRRDFLDTDTVKNHLRLKWLKPW